MEEKAIIVTGGAGFIGSHLVERLVRDGEQVIVIDDESTGARSNLANVRSHPNLTVHVGRVSECSTFPAFAARSKALFHLAAAVGVDLVVRSPIQTMQTNLDETEAVLEVASRHRLPVLLASTSEVYGKSRKEAFTETDDLIIGPPYLARWGYACSKLTDEFMAMAYSRERKLPVIIARLFNTVGPRQLGRYGMVLPRFIAAARKGSPLRVFGNGHQTRCFCYVADTVEALVRLQRSPTTWGEVFNVGSQEEISILELASQVIRTLDSRSEIELVSYEDAYAPGFEDMLRRRPVIEKLRNATGFLPTTSLSEIIGLTAAWQETAEGSGVVTD